MQTGSFWPWILKSGHSGKCQSRCDLTTSDPREPEYRGMVIIRWTVVLFFSAKGVQRIHSSLPFRLDLHGIAAESARQPRPALRSRHLVGVADQQGRVITAWNQSARQRSPSRFVGYCRGKIEPRYFWRSPTTCKGYWFTVAQPIFARIGPNRPRSDLSLFTRVQPGGIVKV